MAEFPSRYWNLEYDDPLRLEIREKLAFQQMQRNSEVLERLSLEDLIPQVYEYSNGEVVLHTMSDNACLGIRGAGGQHRPWHLQHLLA